ncbi:MAG TPA: hypothetical protein VF730_09890 [Terracidiphilus sp.]
MGAEAAGHEEAKDGLAIQRAILSLMRAQGREMTALAEEPDWQAAARPEPAADEASSENPDTIINLLCAIQSSEIGARLRGEGRGNNGQSQPIAFDERALLSAIQSTETAAQLENGAGRGNGQHHLPDVDGQALLNAIQGTEIAALLEREISGGNGQAQGIPLDGSAIAADLAAAKPPLATPSAEDTRQTGIELERSLAPQPTATIEVSHTDGVPESAPPAGAAVDGLEGATALSEAAAALPIFPGALDAAPSTTDEVIAEFEGAPIATSDEADLAAAEPPVMEMQFAEDSSESVGQPPLLESSIDTQLPDASRGTELLRITRRSSVRARRRRISKPLRILEIPPLPTPTVAQPETSFEPPPASVQVNPAALWDDHSSVAESSFVTSAVDSAFTISVDAAAPSAETPASATACEASASEKVTLLQPDAPAEDTSPQSQAPASLNGDGIRPPVLDVPRLDEQVLPSFTRKVGAKPNGELNPLAWTAGVTSLCLDRAETQLESWFLKWFEPPDPRLSTRVERPPLVAYHWIVDSPQALKIANISSGGLYLITEDRWSEGNIISMTLQRTDREKGSPESWIAVDFIVMRWCKDGIAGAFLPHTPGLSDAVAGRAKNCADKKTLERFVKELAYS